MSADKKKLCFVIMPFKNEMKEVYNKAIKPASEKAGFNCVRVDELKGPFNIHRAIIEYIFMSDVIVADLTNWNANVFYEMGVAHAIDNKTIMIIEENHKMPFDIHNYNCIKYAQTVEGLELLKAKLIDSLDCCESWRLNPTNPVQDFKPHEAFVPKSDFKKLENLLKEKETLLKNTVPHQKYIEQTRKIENLQKEIAALSTTAHEVNALKQENDKLKEQLKQSAPSSKPKISVISDKKPLLRSEPLELGVDEAKAMIRKLDFFDKYNNEQGKGISHNYKSNKFNGDSVVIDEATGLMWQQGGTSEYITYDKVKEYIAELNRKKFAGFSDWRLPTLEEAMSLMEQKKTGDLYIDSVFDQNQRHIWTADLLKGESWAWVVDFSYGLCGSNSLLYYYYVRGVRSGQLSGGH